MFNVGPLEFFVLAVIGLIVLGPDRLPGLARDAARMLRTLREMATGAREQLREELGPDFADVIPDDLRKLDPRSAITRAVLGDTNTSDLNPSNMLRDFLAEDASETPKPVSQQAPQPASAKPVIAGDASAEQPVLFDPDAT